MSGFFYLLGSLALILLDFLFKKWAVLSLKPIGHFDIIKNVLSLHYHENYGAAFGILQQKKWFLIVFTSIMLALLVYLLFDKKLQKPILNTSLMLIIGGGVGNLIDRIVKGYVVDYIYFEPINFPIFNFADICVVCGTILLFIYLLFFDKSDEKAEKLEFVDRFSGEIVSTESDKENNK